jgi:two-component system response regulator CpxR
MSDDVQLRVLLSELLLAHGYLVVMTEISATERVGDVDVVVIDATAGPGGRVVDRPRGNARSWVVILSSKDAGDHPADLERAADVLLRKPFDARELLLIIRGMVQERARWLAHAAGEAHSVGPLTLDTTLNTITIDSRECLLTDVESRILAELMSQPGQAVTRERLMQQGLARPWSPLDRTLDMHINRLRRKVGTDVRGRPPIRTVRGIGYFLLPTWEPERPTAATGGLGEGCREG